MGSQCALVAPQTGALQLVSRGRGVHVVGAVAIGADQGGLAMHAAGIRAEDGIVTFAARGSGRCVVGGFGHHRMRTVAVGADGRARVALTQQGGMNTALVELEYGGVTRVADLRQRELIFTDTGDLRLERRMGFERNVAMADGAPDHVMDRFRKRRSLHVQGECFSVRQFFLEPLDGMAAETFLVLFGKNAAGGAGGQARDSEHYQHQCQPGNNDQVRAERRSCRCAFASGTRHSCPLTVAEHDMHPQCRMD